MSRLPSCAARVAVLTLSFATTAAAQVRTDSIASLPAIIVTATRVPLPAVTSAATVLDGEALRAQGMVTVADALRGVPGLAITPTSSHGTRTSVYARGGEAGYMRVMIDGVPVNEPGGEYDLAHLAVEHVDRIEVIRGPSSVLYGTDAVTGVIHVFTRGGTASARHVSAALRGGSFGSRGIDAAVHGAGPRVAYRLGGSVSATDGIHAFNSGYDRRGLVGSVALRGPPRTDAALSVHATRTTTHVPTDGAGRLADRNAYQHGDRIAAGLDAGHRVSRRVELRAQLATSSSDGGFTDLADDAADTLAFFASASRDRVHRRSADIRANVDLSRDVVLSAGAVYEHQGQVGDSWSDSEWGRFEGSTDVSRSGRAGYVQLLGHGRRVRWNASARLDRSSAFGTFTTWRGGVAANVARGWEIRVVGGRAFREPTFYQNFAQGFVTGNPALRPEQSRSWEAGISRRVGTFAQVGATWFSQQFDDLIEYRPTDAPTDPSYVNVAGARARGVEIEAAVRPAPRVALEASYTWLDAKVTDAGNDRSGTGFFVPGASLLRRPAHGAAMRATWAAGDRAGVSLGVVHQGRRDDIDYAAGGRVSLAAYTLVDISGSLAVIAPRGGRPGVAAVARIANVLDEAYQSVFGFRTPGRELQVTLRVE